MSEREPLGPRTTFRVGGPARFFTEVSSEAALAEALAHAGTLGVPAFVLGGGSNLLVADSGLDALVVRVALRGLTFEEGSGVTTLRAGAGEAWDAVVAAAVARGLSGLECLSGIPGDAGATPIQNVGAYGQEVADTIVSVNVIDRVSGNAVTLDPAACAFGYRDSAFKRDLRGRYVVTSVAFRLAQGGEPAIRYPELERALGSEPRTASHVRDTVIALRRKKGMVLDETDADTRSAGSFFTNPLVPAAAAPAVEERARSLGVLGPGEAMPAWPQADGRTKLSAAWLIERAGFVKGTRRGRAGISSKHSLALVNLGGASAAEITALAREVQGGVEARFGVRLHPEPELVGFTPTELGALIAT